MMTMWWRPFVLAHIIVAVAKADTIDKDDPSCRGQEVILEVSSSRPAGNITLHGSPANFGSSLTSSLQGPFKITLADPITACEPFPPTLRYSGAAVLISRGDCSFTAKAQHAQAFNASLVIIYNNSPGCFGMASNSSKVSAGVSIPALSVSQDAGRALMQAAAEGGLVSARLLPQKLDPGDALMWLIAIGTLWVAAQWAGSDFLLESSFRRRSAEGGTPREVMLVLLPPNAMLAAVDGVVTSGRLNQDARKKDSTPDVVEVSLVGAVTLIVVSSAWLLLIFFFNNVVRIILVILFAFGAVVSLMEILVPALQYTMPTSAHRSRTLQLTRTCHVEIAEAVAFPCCLGLVVAWAFLADKAGGWLLTDVLGISVLLLFLRQIRLHSLKVGTTLLLLAFAYDIFWVILQPLLLGGPSVMVEVATGGDSHIPIPFLLIVPHLLNPEMSILGFGDIVLPGLLIVFTRIYDLKHERKGWSSYFYPCLVAYAVGLVLTYIALLLRIGGQQGQPALMWLVPCTLGIALLLGWRRGDLRGMWIGCNDEASLVEGKGETRLPSIQEDDLEQGESMPVRADLNHSLLNRGSSGSM